MELEYRSRGLCLVFGCILCPLGYALDVFDAFLVWGGLAAAFGILVGLWGASCCTFLLGDNTKQGGLVGSGPWA
jgi:hypothetical protein